MTINFFLFAAYLLDYDGNRFLFFALFAIFSAFVRLKTASYMLCGSHLKRVGQIGDVSRKRNPPVQQDFFPAGVNTTHAHIVCLRAENHFILSKFSISKDKSPWTEKTKTA